MTVAIISIAMAIGIPSMSTWMQNNQVKTTAQSLLAGLQLARGTAISQNRLAQFTLTGTSAGTADWQVIASSSSGSLSSGTTTIQTVTSAEMGANAVVGVSSATQASSSCCTTAITAGTGMGSSPAVVFDAFGRSTSASTITRIDVTSTIDSSSSASDAAFRRRVILISPSGSTILCRPSLPSTNSQGCP